MSNVIDFPTTTACQPPAVALASPVLFETNTSGLSPELVRLFDAYHAAYARAREYDSVVCAMAKRGASVHDIGRIEDKQGLHYDCAWNVADEILRTEPKTFADAQAQVRLFVHEHLSAQTPESIEADREASFVASLPARFSRVLGGAS